MSFKHQTEGFDSHFSCLSLIFFNIAVTGSTAGYQQEYKKKNELWQHNKKRRVNILLKCGPIMFYSSSHKNSSKTITFQMFFRYETESEQNHLKINKLQNQYLKYKQKQQNTYMIMSCPKMCLE